jgi:pilus assembly protein CpaE
MNSPGFDGALHAQTAALRFVCASADPARAPWLQRTLGQTGIVDAAPADSAALLAGIAQRETAAVFVDFAEHDASALAQSARNAFPGVPIVALGTLSSPVSAVLALRAGVRDFIDVNGPPADVLAAVERVLEARRDTPAESPRHEPAHRHGKLTVLLGARAGMGVSTLAAHLAVALQRHGEAARRCTALIDLGLPTGDTALLLDTQGTLHFFDAVRNLRRFDQTFVNAAFARHASGLAFTTLPADLTAMRAISFASVVATLDRLRVFFDHLIVDLGAMSNPEFVAQVARAADNAWVVCDPNVTSAVSAMAMIEALRGVEPEQTAADHADPAPLNLGLVVNKFDAALNFGADQVAQRLGVPLVGVLPQRAQALGRAVNQGRLLSECAERDPYVRALAPFVALLAGEADATRPAASAASHLAHFLPHFLRRS